MNAIPSFAPQGAAKELLRTALTIVPGSATSMASLQETSDDYSRVLFLAPGGRLRVIICNGGIQWIVQTRRPLRVKERTSVWRSQSFCTTRQGLRRSLREQINAGFPGLEEFLDRLPESFNATRGQPA